METFRISTFSHFHIDPITQLRHNGIPLYAVTHVPRRDSHFSHLDFSKFCIFQKFLGFHRFLGFSNFFGISQIFGIFKFFWDLYKFGAAPLRRKSGKFGPKGSQGAPNTSKIVQDWSKISPKLPIFTKLCGNMAICLHTL